MKHIVIDFEMQHGEMQLLQSAPNVYQTEIIEIGAVMLNDEFEFVSEFKSYVHPSYGKLPDNIAILTGIKDSDKLFRSNAGQAKGNPTANHKSHDKEGFSVKEF